MFQLNYQPSDLPRSTAISTSASSSAPPSTLSKGAVAGIAVGAAIGLLLLSLASFFTWKYRSDRKGVLNAEADAEPAEVDAKPAEVDAKPAELGPSQWRTYEMSSVREPAELPGAASEQ